MGKKRITAIDDFKDEDTPETQGEKKVKVKKEPQAKAEKKSRVPGLKGGERITVIQPEEEPEPIVEEAKVEEKAPKQVKKAGVKKTRGKNYKSAKTKVDQAQAYPLKEALNLLQDTSYGKFDSAAEAHVLTSKKDVRGQASLPYFKGKSRRVAVANKVVLDKIEAGKIDFDVLLTTPSFMPNLVKFAKVLGPKGLMPNPKNGTIVDDPEKALKQFEQEAFSFRTEANAPLIHVVFGRVSQKPEELEANLKAFLQAVGSKNIQKVVISSTMGPGIKINTTSLF
ncbi:MAG: hypothetical protein Q7S03_04310 [bacterium]|nr:hypothetical protein [bacterium]